MCCRQAERIQPGKEQGTPLGGPASRRSSVLHAYSARLSAGGTLSVSCKPIEHKMGSGAWALAGSTHGSLRGAGINSAGQGVMTPSYADRNVQGGAGLDLRSGTSSSF